MDGKCRLRSNQSNQLFVLLKILIPADFKANLFKEGQLTLTIFDSNKGSVEADGHFVLIDVEVELFLSRLGHSEPSDDRIAAD